MTYLSVREQNAYQNRWMQARRTKWLAENGPCVDCGSSDNLQVDHVDPTKKWSHRIWSYSEDRRAAELSKCVVRCYECHKKKTAQQNGYGLVHGTVAGYKYYCCRCEPCTKANTEKRRQERAGSTVVSAAFS